MIVFCDRIKGDGEVRATRFGRRICARCTRDASERGCDGGGSGRRLEPAALLATTVKVASSDTSAPLGVHGYSPGHCDDAGQPDGRPVFDAGRIAAPSSHFPCAIHEAARPRGSARREAKESNLPTVKFWVLHVDTGNGHMLYGTPLIRCLRQEERRPVW